MSFWCIAKNNQELPEDGLGKRRNALELKAISLQKSVHCVLVNKNDVPE